MIERVGRIILKVYLVTINDPCYHPTLGGRLVPVCQCENLTTVTP